MSTRNGVNGPRTDQTAAMSRPNAPYPKSVSQSLVSSPSRPSAVPGSLVSQNTHRRSAKLTVTCTAAAAANGPMTPGNALGPWAPTCPPNSRKVRPARYALTANIAALNTRWVGDGPRRTPSRVQAPTRAAPTGPQSTTAASDAMLLADQARPREFSRVADDSHATRSRPSAPIWTQSSPPNGPAAI